MIEKILKNSFVNFVLFVVERVFAVDSPILTENKLVQIREICGRARGAIQRFDIRSQLDEIPRHKARRQPQVAQHLD